MGSGNATSTANCLIPILRLQGLADLLQSQIERIKSQLVRTGHAQLNTYLDDATNGRPSSMSASRVSAFLQNLAGNEHLNRKDCQTLSELESETIASDPDCRSSVLASRRSFFVALRFQTQIPVPAATLKAQAIQQEETRHRQALAQWPRAAEVNREVPRRRLSDDNSIDIDPESHNHRRRFVTEAPLHSRYRQIEEEQRRSLSNINEFSGFADLYSFLGDYRRNFHNYTQTALNMNPRSCIARYLRYYAFEQPNYSEARNSPLGLSRLFEEMPPECINRNFRWQFGDHIADFTRVQFKEVVKNYNILHTPERFSAAVESYIANQRAAEEARHAQNLRSIESRFPLLPRFAGDRPALETCVTQKNSPGEPIGIQNRLCYQLSLGELLSTQRISADDILASHQRQLNATTSAGGCRYNILGNRGHPSETTVFHSAPSTFRDTSIIRFQESPRSTPASLNHQSFPAQ